MSVGWRAAFHHRPGSVLFWFVVGFLSGLLTGLGLIYALINAVAFAGIYADGHEAGWKRGAA